MESWCKRVAAGFAGVVVVVTIGTIVTLVITRNALVRWPGTGCVITALRFVFCIPRDPPARAGDTEAFNERDTSVDVNVMDRLGVTIPPAGLPPLHYRRVAAGQDL